MQRKGPPMVSCLRFSFQVVEKLRPFPWGRHLDSLKDGERDA
jgi:hypothetical protein